MTPTTGRGTVIITYYIRLILYPAVQWSSFTYSRHAMQHVSFDCVGYQHIYIFRIAINLIIWSHFPVLYVKPKFGSYSYTLHDPNSIPSFAASAFWRSSPSNYLMCTLYPMRKGLWCQLIYLYQHPAITLMCDPRHLCLLAPPLYLLFLFDT